MKTAHLLIVPAVLAVLAVSSLGIHHWARDTVTAPKDANRESSRSVASVRDVASRASAPTPNNTAGVAWTPPPGIPSRSPIPDMAQRQGASSVGTTAAAPVLTDEASSSLDRSGTPDAPGDPEAQPETPSEQFMHSRRGDGQHQE